MSFLHEFIPKSFQCLRMGYGFGSFRKDLIAGITVAVIALPLAMAFAIASGVSPERGIFTAIIAGFLISLLGGSRIQIGGPTGAFVIIVYDVIQRTGYEGLCTATLIAAALLIAIALFRFGSWIKYVPHPLIIGFTSGIAVIIFSSQIKDFFGLKMGTPPSEFTAKWISYFNALPTLDPLTLSYAGATLGVILLIRKYFPILPWGISAIVLSTSIAIIFDLPLETINSRFGQIPRMLPMPTIPVLAMPTQEILFDALTIAFLGGIESLLSAVIGDGMIGGRHRSNCELFAQGIANFGSILFGGIPATGAIARTAANVKSGAQTPVAGMVHSLTLLLILFCFAGVVSKIPLAALSAVLMMVAWNMSEMGHFFRLFKAPIEDRAILLTSFILTVFVDITVAITIGMILASFLFMRRMSQISKKDEESDHPISERHPGAEVYEIQGPFFFGAAHILRDLLIHTTPQIKVFILGMRQVPFIDASGLYALKEFDSQCKKDNVKLILSEVRAHVKHDLEKYGLEIQMESKTL